MTGPTEPCCLEPSRTAQPENKYFHEVGAEMIDNRLVIRMEKSKSKRKKGLNEWEPPCDCDVIEIKRPTSKKGPRIVNGGDNNQIIFRIHSKAHLTKKEDPNYKPQAIAYRINKSDAETDHCRKITIYPHLGGLISQEVYSDHVTEADHDVYLLRVKKKNNAPDDGGHRRNLEVELRTPKPPPKLSGPQPINDLKPEKSEYEKKDDNDKKKKKPKNSKNAKKKKK